jgi:hypothetical protein
MDGTWNLDGISAEPAQHIGRRHEADVSPAREKAGALELGMGRPCVGNLVVRPALTRRFPITTCRPH